MASPETSLFTLEIGGHSPGTFRVLEFAGQEALSENFVFRVKAVASDVPLKYDDTIGNAAILAVKGRDYAIRHFGIITHFTVVPESDGASKVDFHYDFTIEPSLKYPAYHLRSRIFHNKNVQAIVGEVLGEYLEAGKAFRFEAKVEEPLKDYPKREFTVQYNETDWDFVKRLLEDEGIYWFWTHEEDRDVLVMASGTRSVKPLPKHPDLPFKPEGGLSHDEGREYVDSLEMSVRYVTGRASVKDYNYRTPEVKVLGQHELVGPGGYHHFGDHVKTTDEAARKARIRAEMFACGRVVYKGTGVFRDARPGYRFKLSEAAAEGFDGEYLITRVAHAGGFDPATGKAEDASRGPAAHYRCAFEAIPAATVYRPPLATPKPRVNGILTALVDGQKGQYAYIDDEGRYKVKMFFDPAEEQDVQASKAIRLAQPYAGPGYGMHFPLHTGTEIAIGFVDGDLDRPIGLGAVPNPAKGSPVKAANKSQNMMRSHSGNAVTLEDKEGKTGVHIGSAGGHSAALNDDGGAKGIALTTSGSNSLALDDTKKSIGLRTAAGNEATLDDQGQAITLKTTGGNTLVMEDGGHKITLKDGSGNITVTLEGDAGKLTLDAKQEILLKVGQSRLSLKMDGTIELKGQNVTVKGNVSATVEGTANAAVKGTALALNGKGSANLSGGVVEIKADTALTQKGAMVTSDASAVNIVKGGAAVMLNP